MPTSYEFKDQGNKAFQAGDYKEAEALYTKAIQKSPTNPVFFTNRAFARLRLSSHAGALGDALKAIELDRGSMKGYYYLAQAQLALSHPNEALSSALTAYELCLSQPARHGASAASACDLVLRAKKEKWERRETERLRNRSRLLAELEDALRASAGARIAALDDAAGPRLGRVQAAEERAELEAERDAALAELRTVFALADPAALRRRDVPDWIVDHISFGVMHDPVVTANGHSYERSNIERHLAASATDPLTRAPLTKADLRPNLALRDACAQFLEENGWAVDW